MTLRCKDIFGYFDASLMIRSGVREYADGQYSVPHGGASA